jgi:hypothetical protein
MTWPVVMPDGGMWRRGGLDRRRQARFPVARSGAATPTAASPAAATRPVHPGDRDGRYPPTGLAVPQGWLAWPGRRRGQYLSCHPDAVRVPPDQSVRALGQNDRPLVCGTRSASMHPSNTGPSETLPGGYRVGGLWHAGEGLVARAHDRRHGDGAQRRRQSGSTLISCMAVWS